MYFGGQSSLLEIEPVYSSTLLSFCHHVSTHTHLCPPTLLTVPATWFCYSLCEWCVFSAHTLSLPVCSHVYIPCENVMHITVGLFQVAYVGMYI